MRIPTPRPALLATLTPLLLALPTSALSAATTLTTTQTQYCSAPDDIFVNAFSATYHRANQSIVFYLSLDTTQSNADVTARASVDAYGMQLINQEIDLCQILSGVLCPLPSLNLSSECGTSDDWGGEREEIMWRASAGEWRELQLDGAVAAPMRRWLCDRPGAEHSSTRMI